LPSEPLPKFPEYPPLFFSDREIYNLPVALIHIPKIH